MLINAAKRIDRRGWLGFVAAGLLGAFVALLHLTANAALERIEGATLDWRFMLRGAIPAPDDVAIIAIDDRSLAELGRWPWPREKLADIVDRLGDAGATTIGIDILLLEPDTPSGDAALSQSLKRQGNGILALGMLVDGGEPSAEAQEDVRSLALPAYLKPEIGALEPLRASGVLRPISVFEAVAKVGHVNLQPDAGGSPRLHFPVIALGEALLPSFPLLAVAGQRGLPTSAISLSLDGRLVLPSGDSTPRQVVDLGPNLGLPLNFFGSAGTIATYSAADLLAGGLSADKLQGRIVLVGATATGLRDDFVTPFDSALPGVEILATSMVNLLDDNYLRRSTGQILLEAGVIVLLTLSAWGLGQAPGPRLGLGLNLVLLIAWLALSQVMLVTSLRWIAVAGPSLGIVLGSTIAVAGRMVRERRLRGEVERQRGNLARYVPPSLADALADKEGSAFDGQEQMAAILFVDLQGFTTASESRSPSETAHFLKDFHAQLEGVVSKHRGIIAQFLGDGAFIMWGLPQPTSDDPALALACAREMLQRLRDWKPEMTARIGVHFGPVAMAQLGGQNQLQLAAAGDTVNVASRLEAIAKEVGAILTISDVLASAIRALGRHDLLLGLTAQPARRVRGRDQLLGYWSAKSVPELNV
ncbi:CHASE2 domain-containing protein [Dongia sp.]|uniref:CHASE2 domain-containing protein n=1 Tax=Dongia sp. TaxID=1977262 RepID=UPI0035B34DBF